VNKTENIALGKTCNTAINHNINATPDPDPTLATLPSTLHLNTLKQLCLPQLLLLLNHINIPLPYHRLDPKRSDPKKSTNRGQLHQEIFVECSNYAR
jgi:hypothetical protein